MVVFLFIVFFIVCFMFPAFRCFLTHIPSTIYWTVNDLIEYVKKKKWQEWSDSYSGIFCFVGMFGRGKTLSATKYAVDIYNKYARFGKTVRIVSNYALKSVPYIPLVNFEQIVELGNLAVEGKDECVGTIVLIDEIEMLFSHRKFASFPIEVLSSVCQSRKAHIMMITTCQRWKMQDAAIRDITYWAINCKKYWRFQTNTWFDAWDLENAANPTQVRPLKRGAWFVYNKYYKSYDTTKLISRDDMKNFISNDELLQRRYANTLTDPDAIKHPSRRYTKSKRKAKAVK